MMVRLRCASQDDSANLYRWRNLDSVRQWMYTDHKIPPEEHAAWLGQALQDPTRRYWIIEMDHAPVGCAYLTSIDGGSRRCSWGFYLGEESVRGRGVGTATEYLMLRETFDVMGLNRLQCEVLLGNDAVISLHERFGFRREGYLRRYVHRSDGWHDVVVLAMLASEWELLRDGLLRNLVSRGVEL